MHLSLQGHVKWLIKKFFYTKNAVCYVGKNTDSLNSIIKKMKVPHFINRKFPLLDVIEKLKSSELKIFIFYWALPLLLSFLDSELWYLLCQYVFSVRILYEPIQDRSVIKVADDLINSYVRLSSQIYGKEVADYTVHAHLHLPKQVLRHGPLHCHSQFAFEVNFHFIYPR